MKIKLDDREAKAVVRKLKTFGKRMEKAGMRKVVNAGATPIVRVLRKSLPKGHGLKLSGEKRKHLSQTIIKKVKTYSNNGGESFTYTAVFGHRYPMLGHSFWLYQGVKPHAIVAGIRGRDARRSGSGKATGKRVLSDKKKFYGRRVQHPGFRGKDFVGQAIVQSQQQSIQAMTAKAREVIAKAAESK